MLKKSVDARIKISMTFGTLLMLTFYSPGSYSAPKEVNIDSEHIFINSPQDEETLFNITNGGSLTISSTSAGFTSRAQSHQLNDSTLTLDSKAVFSGDINSASSHIFFSDSTYTGNIRAVTGESLGDIYINDSEFNGSIRTGVNNNANTVTIKDSQFNGQGVLSPLMIYSGSLIIENTSFNNHNFPVIDIRNAYSAILHNIHITNTSDFSGTATTGLAGVLLQDSQNVEMLNADISSDGTAIRMLNNAEDDVTNNLFIRDSTLKAKGAAALEATNSNIIIYQSLLHSLSDGSSLACYSGSTAINGCGALNLSGTQALIGQHSTIESNNVGVFITGETPTQLDIVDSSINAQKAAFSINEGSADIAVRNSRSSVDFTPTITSGENRLLEALNGSKVDFSLYNVSTRGDVFADESSRVNMLLSGSSSLEGNITGVDMLEISRNARWQMTADNNVKIMLLTGGSVLLPEPASDNQFHTLTIDSLGGAGMFALNTNLQTMQGDKLNITRDLYGTFLLRVTNSGVEPADPAAQLQLVQGPSETAIFTLEGDKVDAGVWQYELIKKGSSWYLVNSNQPDTPDTPDDSGTIIPHPSLTPSADALLNLASAPAYIFNSELQNLRQRRGGNHSQGGVWGRYINQNARINTDISNWKLGQNGFELGGDRAVAVREGDLFVGLMASITNNSVRDARGGNSQIDSYAAGAYASWFDDSGLYIDAVIKANRFNSRLHTRMSDSEAVSGGYSQNSLGGALESGWRFTLADNYQLEPFARIAAFQATASSTRLSNGMTAQIHRPSSLQAETGLHFGKRIQLNKAVLTPYLKASVAHEFVNSAKVRLNDSWNFNAGTTGSIGKYGAGIDIELAKNASLFTQIDYQKGRAMASPVTANLGFRIGF